MNGKHQTPLKKDHAPTPGGGGGGIVGWGERGNGDISTLPCTRVRRHVSLACTASSVLWGKFISLRDLSPASMLEISISSS